MKRSTAIIDEEASREYDHNLLSADCQGVDPTLAGRVPRRRPALDQASDRLLLLADQHAVPTVAARLGVCTQTIYNWLHAFILDRWASLRPRRSPGRPPKLTPSQKQRLRELLDAGPEAAG